MIRCVRELVPRTLRELTPRQKRFFAWASLAGLGLRVLLVVYFPGVVDDSRLYANIAENWLRHGVYGITNSGAIMPTLSRLPGYPAFLAAIFAVFGVGNFRAVLLVQILFDLATCFLIADLARRLFSWRAAQAAFLLAALCPFLANYAAAALTETLETFFTALALDLAFCGLRVGDDRGENPSRSLIWLGCGLSVGGAILLRPDGGILLAAIGAYTALAAFAQPANRPSQSTSPALGGSAGRGRSARSAGSLDSAESAHPASFRAAGPPLCHRLRRVGHARLQSLGQNLDRGLRFRPGRSTGPSPAQTLT